MTPGSQSPELDAMRSGVAAAARRLAELGLVIGTGGNISARSGDRIAITATGAELRSLGPEGVSIIDRSGHLIDGELQPSSEVALHLGIYEHYEAGAVVHTHSPVATALSCVLDEVPCVHYQMLLLGGTVPVAPYRTFGTPELAEATVAALQGKTAALMANHGAIVYAHDLDHAVANAQLLEWACEVYREAAAVGKPRVLDQASQQGVIDAAVARSYGSTHEAQS